jgi:hypothetical protein
MELEELYRLIRHEASSVKWFNDNSTNLLTSSIVRNILYDPLM